MSGKHLVLCFAVLVASCWFVAASALTCSEVPKPEKAIRCYICKAKDPSNKNDPCIKNGELVTPGAPCVACFKNYCTIFRQEEKATKTAVSFFRSCEDDINEELTDSINRTIYDVYYSKCNSDRCNRLGDGTEDVITVGDEDFFDAQLNVVVPGVMPKSQAVPMFLENFNWKAWAVAIGCLAFTWKFQRVPAILDVNARQ